MSTGPAEQDAPSESASLPATAAAAQVAPEPPGTPPRSHIELFLGFFSIGARAFGGVLPWAHRAIVEERRWLNAHEFAEVLALCQLVPGPNVANCAVALGRRWFGLSGALVAYLALMAPPFAWVLCLALVYPAFIAHPLAKAFVTGVGCAGAGLFIATALRLARPIARRPVAIALIAACFVCVAIAKLSLLVVMPIALAAAALAARRRLL